MEFIVKSGNPEKQRSACVVVGIFEPRRLSTAAEQLDKASAGFISSLIRRGDMEGTAGQTLLLYNIPNTLCDRVLLVGCGKERDFNINEYHKVIINATSALNDGGSMEAVYYLPELSIKGRTIEWKITQAIIAAKNALYHYDHTKSKSTPPRRPLRKVILSIPSRRDLSSSEQAVKTGLAIANGMALSRELGNLPGNICTPSYLAEQAITLAKDCDNLHCEILEEADMEALGMGSLLSVSRGSRQAAKLIIMNYTGGDPAQKPVVFVGKGLTFDAGGISLKPAAAMDEMKYDMCGSAGVFGAMQACIDLELPINLIGVIPSSENMPDGDANKPGDVVTSMSGQTIEILNTDAEGRLILCDALTYCERFDPAVVVDMATLTGACVIALGKHAHGLFSNHNPLAHDLLNAGKTVGDRAWEMPLWEEYQEQLKSNFADMANIGGREAGAVTAACFLSRYTKKFRWAHLDIAGTAWISGGSHKGSTGRPVPLLVQFLLDRISHKK